MTQKTLLAGGMISPEDWEQLHVTDDPEDAVKYVVDAYWWPRVLVTKTPAEPAKADAPVTANGRRSRPLASRSGVTG